MVLEYSTIVKKQKNCFQFSPVPFKRKPLEGLQVQIPETSMGKSSNMCGIFYSILFTACITLSELLLSVYGTVSEANPTAIRAELEE